jgi:hypothetical protein
MKTTQSFVSSSFCGINHSIRRDLTVPIQAGPRYSSVHAKVCRFDDDISDLRVFIYTLCQ